MKSRKIFRSILSIFMALVLSTMFSMSAIAEAGPMSSKQPNEISTVSSILSDDSKITDRLQEAINKQRSANIPVLVWLNDVDLSTASTQAARSLNKNIDTYEQLISRDDVTMAEMQQYIETKRANAAVQYKAHNEEIANKYFESNDIIYISQYSPVIILNMDADTVTSTAEKNDVVFLDCYIESDEVEVTVANNVTRATNVHNTYGYGGAGVKIGVYEANITNASFPGINLISQNGTVGSATSHANSVFQIISSVAPAATYYVVDSSVQTEMQAIEWLISQGVNVITASRVIGGDGLNTYGSMSRWLDHIAYNHDIHFVKSAGNSGTSGVTSGGMAYNILTVGNIDDNRTVSYTDDIIRYTSSRYSGTGLAYKPDICAPGTELVTRFSDAFTGTSAAAPQVAGTIALLCQGNPTLTVRQDVVKAILTASVNFSSPHAYIPSNSSYRTFGAGLLDTYGAVWVAENIRYVASSISTSTSSQTYTFTVTNADDRMRVSLAYLRNANITSSSHESATPTVSSLSNLDIEIYAPGSTTPIATSTTTYNNIEIVDFEPTTTGTYRIVIKNKSSAATTYYGLAWR